MDSDLSAATSNSENEMRAWMNGGKARHPDMLKEPQDGKLALLVDERVVGQNREVEVQVKSPGST